MTVTQLIKALEKLRAKHGNVKVCANAEGMLKAFNEVYTIVDVKTAEFALIRIADGDGFTEYDSRGHERQQECIVLGYYPLAG